jgi:hypothetical protein
MFQVQFSFGPQGPQTTFALGAEVRRHDLPLPTPEFNRGNVINVFSEAIRSQILIFQTTTGHLSEQNLFNVVISAIIFLHLHSTSYDERLRNLTEMTPDMLNLNSDLQLSFTALHNILANTVAATHGTSLSGLDLMSLIGRGHLKVVEESIPRTTSLLRDTPLGRLPCLAVHSLETTYQAPQLNFACQPSLLVTVRLLEETIGPLYLDNHHNVASTGEMIFSSTGGTQIIMRGVTDATIRAVRHRWPVSKLKWNERNSIITPGEILVGQNPAIINGAPLIQQLWRWVPWCENGFVGNTGIRLSELVHETRLQKCELGVLLFCT